MKHPILTVLPPLITSLLAQGTPEIEPNDTFAMATPLALGAQGEGAIGVSGDFDFWQVTLASNSDLRCWLNPGLGSSLADSDLALIASDGTTVVTFNDDATSPASLLSAVVAGDLAAGNYYLRVRSSQTADPTGTGTYTLDVVAASPGTYVVGVGGGPGIPTPVTEAPENNDPRQAGGVATLSFDNSSNLGNLATATPGIGYADPGADYDFFALNATRSGMLTMRTLPTASAPAATNTVLFLVDAGLAPIAVDDDGGPGLLSLMTEYITPGQYYVVVKGWDTGNYELEVRLTPSPPPGAATVTTQIGGCGPTLGVRQTVAGPMVATEVPVLGSAYYIDGQNMPPNTLVLHVIGTVTLASPFDLTSIGAPGCILEVDPIDQSPSMTSGSGTDYWVLNLPLDLALIGLTIEQQSAVVDALANPLGMTMTNRVSSVCGVHN